MAATQMQGRGPPKGSIELFSPTYFAACGLGGIISCGPTHTCKALLRSRIILTSTRLEVFLIFTDSITAVTPLDLVRSFVPRTLLDTFYEV